MYQETQNGLTTDVAGVFSTVIGASGATVASGYKYSSFSNIDFSIQYNIQVGVAINGGAAVTIGTYILQAVPYVKYASNGVPPGTIMAYAGTTCPAGWVFCDGTVYDGVNINYAALYAAIGTNWGNGTTIAVGTISNATGASKPFNVPDLRGMFLRGVDGTRGDLPDEKNRLSIFSGSNTGNNVGSYESNSTALPQNPLTTSNPGDHWHMVATQAFAAAKGGDFIALAAGSGTTYTGSGLSGGHTHSISGGDNETRPRNMAVYYIIKL